MLTTTHPEYIFLSTDIHPSSSIQVEAELKERIRVLGPGSGYIIAPANHLQPDFPAEDVVTLFEAAHKYGRYPLQL